MLQMYMSEELEDLLEMLSATKNLEEKNIVNALFHKMHLNKYTE